MSTTITPTLPQPNVNQTQIIETIFHVANMALFAIGMVPGIPANVVIIAKTALTDIENAYAVYTANPTADLYDDIVKIADDAFANIKSILHP